LTNKKSVYFGAGWFTDTQNKAYKQAMQALKDNPTIDETRNYVPLEHQYKNIRVDEHPEYLHDKEWATATFLGDIAGLNQSDIATFVYVPEEEDIGCGVEMGYAYAHGKPVVVIIPDEQWGKEINLMSWGTGTNYIKLSELATFDFNNISYNFYDGAVY
jgi:nucleoside deoxyribosyltransferase